MNDVSDRIKNMVRRQLAADSTVTNQELYDKAKEMEPSIGELTLRQFNARYPLQVRRWEMTSSDEERERARQKRALEQPVEEPAASLPPLEWSAGGFRSKPGGRPSPGRGLESSPKWPFAREPDPPLNGDPKEQAGTGSADEDGAAASTGQTAAPPPVAEPRRPPVQLVLDDDDDDVEQASPEAALVEHEEDAEPYADEEELDAVEASVDRRPGDEVREMLLELAGRIVDAQGPADWLEIGADLAGYAGRIVDLANG